MKKKFFFFSTSGGDVGEDVGVIASTPFCALLKSPMIDSAAVSKMAVVSGDEDDEEMDEKEVSFFSTSGDDDDEEEGVIASTPFCALLKSPIIDSAAVSEMAVVSGDEDDGEMDEKEEVSFFSTSCGDVGEEEGVIASTPFCALLKSPMIDSAAVSEMAVVMATWAA